MIDDTIETNADLHYKSGLRPKIIRVTVGNCCDWCNEVAGVHDYEKVKATGNHVFRRHRYCRCRVEYDPGDGRRQDVHTKRWEDYDHDDITKKRIEHNSKLTGVSGAKNYFRDESYDDFLSPEEKRKDIHAYVEYDRIKNSDQKLEKRKIFNNIGQFEEMRDFSKEDVDIAFDHVFNDLHDLGKGPELFNPDYDMAQSRNRLINKNDIQEHDLVLLRHERLEHDIMCKEGLNYDDAHKKASEVYLYRVPNMKEEL